MTVDPRPLIALAIAAAVLLALAVWGYLGRREASELRAWADLACASAGVQFGHDGRATGIDCHRRIAALATFERETHRQSAQVLADAVQETQRKTTTDAASAARDARAARASTERMEKANAAVQDDRVDGDWFGALNDLAGLRHP